MDGAGEGQAFVAPPMSPTPTTTTGTSPTAPLGAQTIARTPPRTGSSADAERVLRRAGRADARAGTRVARIDVAATEVTLSDPTSPTVNSRQRHAAARGEPSRANANVALDAIRRGPGVYSARLTVDGTPSPPRYSTRTTGGARTSGRATDGTRAFAHPDPCPQSASRRPDARHDAPAPTGSTRVKLTVDDASGNATTALDETVTSLNAPANSAPPTIAAAGAAQSGQSVSAAPGSWSAPAGAGAISYGFQWQDCDAAGGGCAAIPDALGASYTPQPPDVGHTLRVLVSASDRDGLSQATSAPTAPVTSPPASSPASAGAANGRGAGEGARIQLNGPGRLTRPFAHSGLTVTGRLVSAAGQPIAGASLEIRERVAGGGERVLTRAMSAVDGAFAARVPAGPSREIRVAYRAFTLDARDTASALVAEQVSARVVLHITPRRIAPGRDDRPQRAGRRSRPPLGGDRRAARSLPWTLGAVSHPAKRRSRALQGLLPLPGRRRHVPVSRGDPRRAGGIRLRAGHERDHQGEDWLSPTTATRLRTVRGRAVVLAACLLGVLAAGVLRPAQVHAGSWIVLSCSLPDGTPAPTEGWSGGSTGPVGPNSGDSNTCASGGALQALVSGASPQSAYAGPDWVFTAPAGSSITGGTLTATLSAPHGQAWLGTPALTYDSADVLANCQYNVACGLSGTLEGSFQIVHPAGGRLYAAAVCVAAVQGATECPAAGGLDAAVSVHGAQIVLANDATPTGQGFAGGLLGGAARGSEDLAFTAADPEGPGVYRVAIQLDTSTLYEGTPDLNGGECAPSGEHEGALMFASTQPCRQSETVDQPLDTTAFADGPHTLKVTVSDAAGNGGVVEDTTITTDNAPAQTAPPSVAGSTPVTGSTLQANPGAWSAPAGAGPVGYAYRWQACQATLTSCTDVPGATGQSFTPGAAQVGRPLRVLVSASDRDGRSEAASAWGEPVAEAPAGGPLLSPLAAGAANGVPASADAVLRLDAPDRMTRGYRHSALHLAGRLTTAAGQPIAGARLALLTRNAGSSVNTKVGETTSAQDGTFSVGVARGPSRTVTVSYTAYAGQPASPASASVRESVPARVRLSVSPRRTSPHGTIDLSGHVDGVGGGVQVNLLVFYRGRWEPFRTPRTDRSGRFHVLYRFEGAVGSFPFRASVPAGQTGLPYAAGASNTVRVLTR